MRLYIPAICSFRLLRSYYVSVIFNPQAKVMFIPYSHLMS